MQLIFHLTIDCMKLLTIHTYYCRLFLAGMQLLGKAEWKKIADHVVITKTHKQVASHAQKYFLHLDKLSKHKRKRSSIHDITTVEPEFLAEVEACLPQHLKGLNQ